MVLIYSRSRCYQNQYLVAASYKVSWASSSLILIRVASSVMASPTDKLANPATQEAIHKLFDEARAKHIAPGFQFVVFDRERTLVNGVSGYSVLPSDLMDTSELTASPSSPEGIKMKPHHIHRILSAGKPALSLVALIILERGLSSNGMTIADLDDHEKLVEILPEFKLGGGNWVTKIIEGWEEGHDEQGRKIPKLRDAKTPVTLRMLFTHSTGIGVVWDSPLDAQMVSISLLMKEKDLKSIVFLSIGHLMVACH
ncbi:hypothetical protein DL93DRAFT_279777 [Clavulina sp. PMI_390]|nr:hypothetical protein DL93DRAFT_279777 [Clavulina sp. PMI_390]